MNNGQLIQRCLHGDAAAWEQLVQRYAGLVHSVPIKYGLTPGEVDDVGQEVFLALAQGLHKIEDPERLPGWLVTTARRYSWRVMQQRAREQPASEADVADLEVLPTTHNLTQTVSDFLTDFEHQEVISLGMQRLGKRCQMLLTLIFLDRAEPSYEEISQQLGIPLGSIGPTRNRCLQQLRKLLEAIGVVGVG
jgi:RNA polymerase sigma factor (sigma-70 family)